MMRTPDPRLWSLGIALVASACGSPAAAPAPPKVTAPIDAARTAASAATAATNAQPSASPAAAPLTVSPGTVAATTAATALTPSPPKYDARGRRDPFESLESRLGSDRSSVTTAKLTGVIQSGGTALALVETSDGIGYILKPGDTIADGRLLEVGVGSAVFSIAPKPGSTNNRVVLRLASD
jgi:hypothetical protein